jgi:biopolymer transport protein ExbB
MSLASRLKQSAIGGVLAAAALTAFASPAHAWWEADYAYRTRINIDPQAAGITGEVARAPVLVRLHSGNFSFADVKPDGSDLRFVAGDDRTPLRFHIERWSVAEQQALVWVDVQGLAPGQASAIYAYYGNAAAEDGQDRAGTYSSDYRLVWHFDNEGAPQDATGNGLAGAGAEPSSSRLLPIRPPALRASPPAPARPLPVASCGAPSLSKCQTRR